MKPRHLRCLAHFSDPPDGSIDVRENLTGPQHYPDNGLVSGTRGEVSHNQEEEDVSDYQGCNSFDVILPLVCRSKTNGGGREFSRKPDHVILSHTLEKTCSRLHECCKIVQELQHYHMHELNWPDIGYNFLIGDDGRVYVGRGWNRMGQFSHEFNEKSLSIAFIGNFFHIPPGPVALGAAKSLIECAVIKDYLMKNYTFHMHEDIECTTNPAPSLKKKIQEWPHYGGEIPNYLGC